MGLFGIFKTSARQAKIEACQEEQQRLAATISELKAQVTTLDAQVGTIHLALGKHEDAIAQCKGLAEQHSRSLAQLEQLVGSGPVRLPTPYISRPAGAPMVAPAARKLNVDQFSEQQKRLLAVFFQNRDRELSYADLGTILGKSAYTIKNQINQIKHKADLFDCVIGPQSRNFFRLKDDLRVEKHLKPGRPVGRPMPVMPDQPLDDYAISEAQPFF